MPDLIEALDRIGDYIWCLCCCAGLLTLMALAVFIAWACALMKG